MAALGWIRQAADRATGRQAEMKLALRVTIAGTLAFAITRALDLPQGYWAAITAVVVMQTSVGGSLKAALDRFSGTLAGAAYGGIIAALLPHSSPVSLGLAVVAALFPLALLAAVSPSFRVAPVTSLIMLLPPTGLEIGPLASAFDRVAEITLGNVVGVVVALFVFPARAHTLMGEAAARVVSLNGDLVAVFIDELTGARGGRASLQNLHPQIRAALKQAEAAADEAMRERASHLTDEANPEPLIRTLYRVRHDLVMVGRAAANPLPAPLLHRLGPTLDSLRGVTCRLLSDLSASLKNRTPPPSPDAFRIAVQALVAQTESLRSDAVLRDLPGDAFGQVFALRFAFEQFRQDLGDLLARARELAGRRTVHAAED
jgi:uncharacterized membrane protein YccC